MMINSNPGKAGLLLCVLGFALHSTATVAQEDEAAPQITESQQIAYDLAIEMANHLAGLESFSVNVLAGYDAPQEDGQKIEFIEARDITLVRPDRMRIEEKIADGGQLVLFDGSSLTVTDGSGIYAQTEQPGGIDDTLVYFIRDLQMRMPLAAVLTTRFPMELQRRITTIDYVEFTHALGAPTHHLAGRTADVDFQVWITDNDEPLPLRLVLTYPDVGQPQYWAQFTSWNLAPKTNASTFTFEVPPDGDRVPFAIQFSTTDTSAPEGAQP